ncbi:hypothetical protein FRB96_006803 [Tulasnella sp. 330]|nr:hypothetical protein FRB96_006803 [Tulasnella sp. 330]KAG8878967.1 hypothetical protein FRB97_002063 [Tulasnella sp. 331]KAG8882770.1 hypothetical protein FRB98_003484 [Tulasnella sp. 332]
MSSNPNVHVLTHPIAKAKLTKLRSKHTNAKDFRETMDALAYIVGIEATRDIPEVEVLDESPIGPLKGSAIQPSIALTPILRAGLGMTNAMLSLFPDAHVYHIGLFREKISLQPVECTSLKAMQHAGGILTFISRAPSNNRANTDYSKLPSTPNVDLVYLLDPLIATAGTAIAALNMITDWGIPTSEEGLRNVTKEFPDLHVWVAGVDEVLTKEGLISPGLGDAAWALTRRLASDAVLEDKRSDSIPRTRFDENYWERLYFHLWDIGGPGAPYQEWTQGSPYQKLRDRWAPILRAYALWLRIIMLPWHERRYRFAAWCLNRLGMKDRSRSMLVKARWYERVEFEEDGEPFPASPEFFEEDVFEGYDDVPPDSQSSSPTETTSLLPRHEAPSAASLYCAWSQFYVVSHQETVLEPDYPKLSTPSSSPKHAHRPSALASKNSRDLCSPFNHKRYLRPKSVRFSGVHKVMFYDKPAWEPIGCHPPNRSHLQSSPLKALISFLRATSFRHSPPSDPPQLASALAV